MTRSFARRPALKPATAAGSVEARLRELIDRYDPAIGAIARAARKSLRSQLPPAMELVYDNYNALVIGFCASDKTRSAVVSLALYPRWVNLFFLHGAGLPDPERLLEGSGKQVRNVVLSDRTIIDSQPVRALISHAVARAPVPFGAVLRRGVEIRAASEKVRPRRPPSRPAT